MPALRRVGDQQLRVATLVKLPWSLVGATTKKNAAVNQEIKFDAQQGTYA
jgi:hypothetical protein